MKDLGKGLATCGIWLGIGLIGWQEPGAGVAACFFGMFATLAVWGMK
jgi:hypothetical protein